MSLTQLSWDSKFFGYKIGKIELRDLDAGGIEREVAWAKQHGFALLYLFGEARVPLSSLWLEENRCRHVDTRVTYEKSGLAHKEGFVSTVRREPAEDGQLYELAYESGKYSRFNLDPQFGKESFQRLYRAWVDNSVFGALADDILVYREGSRLGGFCTVKYRKDKATIGLIAVSPDQQGKGVGRDLWDAVEARAAQQGCESISVATQLANAGACRFYEKMGMKIVESTDTYHLWLHANDPIQ